eukprot:11631218-Prorocentrum_lima.AAC.1
MVAEVAAPSLLRAMRLTAPRLCSHLYSGQRRPGIYRTGWNACPIQHGLAVVPLSVDIVHDAGRAASTDR